MISGRKQSRSFLTLQINAGRYDYLAGSSVHAVSDERILRRQAVRFSGSLSLRPSLYILFMNIIANL